MPHATRTELRVPVYNGSVSAVLTAPDEPLGGFVLGHGAGGTLDTPLLAQVAAGLSGHGFACLRYNFPYSEAGRKRPDFPRVLEATARSAAAALAERLDGRPVVLAGKSLGGRMASRAVAAGGVDAAGLAFLGYPLHPPRKLDELRDAHLGKISCPMLFVQGTRDIYADMGLLTGTLERLRANGSRIHLHVVDGGDHSFRTPAATRRPYDETVDEVVGVMAEWAGALTS
jgi:hypothetical protein